MKLLVLALIFLTLLQGATAGSKKAERRKEVSSKSGKEAPEDYTDVLDNSSLLPFFPEKVENVTVKIGQNAELRCKVENLNNYKVAWVRVDTQTILTIHDNVITRNPRISLSRPSHNQWFLHVQRVQHSDRGWYMCQINTDPMIHRSGYFEVVVPPKILPTEQSMDPVVREGDNLTLSCEASGHPKPHIVWRREDSEDIIIDGKKVTIVESSELRLPKISRLHMGDYLCQASNGIAPSTSKKVRIRVQFPPMFWIPSQLEGAFTGQDVTLECHSEAFPKSINYWVKADGSMLISSSKYETLIVESGYKVYMKLRVKNVSRDDFMQYRCVAKNSLGGSDGSITLYEVPPPSLATTTTTSLSSETSAAILTTSLATTTNSLWDTRKHGGRKRNRQGSRKTNADSKQPDDTEDDETNEDEAFNKINHKSSASFTSNDNNRKNLVTQQGDVSRPTNPFLNDASAHFWMSTPAILLSILIFLIAAHLD